MYFDLEEESSPSHHTSSKGISFILGDGLIESAVENVKKENKNISFDFVINFTSYNKKQDTKTYYIDTFFAFISSLLKF